MNDTQSAGIVVAIGLAIAVCHDANAQFPNCEQQLERARERNSTQWGQIQACHSRPMYEIEYPLRCVPTTPPGNWRCEYETMTPPLEAVPVPEAGLIPTLATSTMLLCLLARRGYRRA